MTTNARCEYERRVPAPILREARWLRFPPHGAGKQATQNIVADRLWHNAGVIGMPANDGQCTTWYSVIRAIGRDLRIEHRQLEYSHRAAARQMRRKGLSHHYANALMTGRWPSLDTDEQDPRTLRAPHARQLNRSRLSTTSRKPPNQRKEW